MMLIEEVSKLPPVGRFLYWIKERHNVHLRRLKGLSKPWTDDEVLQNYFFTNPYRENDKVTQWFRINIRDPLKDSDEVVFATICFRWFTWPHTANILQGEVPKYWGPNRKNLLLDWDLPTAIARLTTAKEDGLQIFTGAYNISNSGSTKPKINRVCEDYIQPVWEDRDALIKAATANLTSNCTMQHLHKALMQYPGMGGSGFMAYEVVCDLRYTKWLCNALDRLTWSNPGPGAKRGLNRILDRPLTTPCKDYQQESTRLLGVANTRLASMPRLEMREIEHSLCEWDKYERARLGDGHMKRRYNAR